MSWKMLNHPEAHLMKLHILLLPPVISWKLLTWAARYLSPPLCLCICLHYLDGKPQRVLPTYARVGSHEVRADGPCVCVCVCVYVCVFRWAGGGGAAERTNEHGGEGAAAPADVTTSQGTNMQRCWTIMWPVFPVSQTFSFALTSHCNFITEACSLTLADVRRPWRLSVSSLSPARLFSVPSGRSLGARHRGSEELWPRAAAAAGRLRGGAGGRVGEDCQAGEEQGASGELWWMRVEARTGSRDLCSLLLMICSSICAPGSHHQAGWGHWGGDRGSDHERRGSWPEW